jgi:hypothetical protein
MFCEILDKFFFNKLLSGGKRLKTGTRLGKNMVYSYQFIKLTHYTVTLQSVNKKKIKLINSNQ